MHDKACWYQIVVSQVQGSHQLWASQAALASRVSHCGGDQVGGLMSKGVTMGPIVAPVGGYHDIDEGLWRRSALGPSLFHVIP